MDSVLLHPGGYRAALIATINHFSTSMGLGELAPTVEEIEAFEAVGITSEWDSAPISVAAIALAPLAGRRPDYVSLARRVAAEWRRGEYPAEAAYRIISNLQSLKRLEIGDWRLEILRHSRDIQKSEVLQVFQQFTLGADFTPTYGLPRTIETEALLLKYDRPALSRPAPPCSAIFTARPSKPPRDIPSRLGYAPEAELGAQLVGLSRLPLIGYGAFQWLAEVSGENANGEAQLKPSPVHALAAIGAALGGPESEAVRAGAAAARGEWLSPLKELRESRGRVAVFEDSAASIRGVREAVRLLGAGWECVGIGIAPGGPKREALMQVADRVYDSIDEALDGE